MNGSISLSTIPSQPDQAFTPMSGPEIEADSVALRIESHPGMFALRRFGEQLRKRPLDGPGLRLFFASTAEFFREVPGGILALALRPQLGDFNDDLRHLGPAPLAAWLRDQLVPEDARLFLPAG